MATNTDPTEVSPPLEDKLEILRRGSAELQGLFRLGSNDTFLCRMESPLGALNAVYKPVRGERPLWDFPAGTLGKREAAAFEVARAIGWDFVPPTVFRAEGPLGPGAFQEYLPLNLEDNYFVLRRREPDLLRRVAAFDIVINNADRKALHIAGDSRGHVWLIDHGVCFHVDWKVRTVVWEFAGEEMPGDVLSALGRFLDSTPVFRPRLAEFLRGDEITALEERTAGLLHARKFPEPGPGVSIPWPILA
jgi:hypothetical protein